MLMLVKCYPQAMLKRKTVFVKDFIECSLLARQGFTFRGDSAEELNSNFAQLLKLYGLDDPRIDDRILKKLINTLNLMFKMNYLR